MFTVNVAACDLEEVYERGAFRCEASTLTERLGARVIGASVYEVRAGDKQGPYHYHHGFEEFMYVVSGAPVLRDPSGSRTLEPGELVAFAAGPSGAHTLRGPGRVVMFSAGANGWGEAFVTVYPDSDKIGAAPGVMFRRRDALNSWRGVASETLGAEDLPQGSAAGRPCPSINLQSTAAVEASAASTSPTGAPLAGRRIGQRLSARTWAATLFELAPGGATAPYHYEWCREEWVLVLAGAPTLRHADGEDVLDPGSMACFPEGPAGAHRLSNHSAGTARLIVFSTPAGRPMSAFYPDEGTVLVRISDEEALLFGLDAHIDDYWDGEPGAVP